MRRPRAVRVAGALGALALTLAACSDDDEAPSETTAPPSETTAPPNVGALPPSLVECFADAGFDVESGDDIHTAPPDVVEECFDELHEGGGS